MQITLFPADRPGFWLYNLLLGLHILSGFVGMYGGLMPMFTSKGGAEHRQWGLIFTWAMGVAAGTALPLAWFRSDPLQAAIGVYSGYLAVFGFRAVRRHKLRGGTQVDWALACSCLGGFLLLSTAGSWAALTATGLTAAKGRVALVLGLLGLAMAGRDLQTLVRGETTPARRVVDHMLATSLAVIVAFAAFFNTQFNRMSGLHWEIDQKMALPFLVGLPLLSYWTFIWDRKLNPGKRKTMNSNETFTEPGPLKRLRLFGIAEGISFLLLLFVAVPMKHLFHQPFLVKAIGPVHGALFVLYVISVFVAAPVMKWNGKKTFAALIASVLPFGTFVFEAKLRKEQALAAA